MLDWDCKLNLKDCGEIPIKNLKNIKYPPSPPPPPILIVSTIILKFKKKLT